MSNNDEIIAPEWGEICPILGSSSDTETPYNFPTRRNRCFADYTQTSISYSHQESYCLGGNYEQCPLYQHPELVRSKRTINEVDAETSDDNQDIHDRQVNFINLNQDLFGSLLIVIVVSLFVGAIVYYFVGRDDAAPSQDAIVATSVLNNANSIFGTIAPRVTFTPSVTVTATSVATLETEAAISSDASVTATATETASSTASATATASPTASFTNTLSATPTATDTAEPIPTELAMSVDDASPTASATNTATDTSTATSTLTATNTASATNTATDVPTATATETATNTNTPTSTATASSTNTATFTATATNTPTNTATHTPTATPTLTPSVTPFPTLTPTASDTPTLVPPATSAVVLSATPRPQPSSGEDIAVVIERIESTYGVSFAVPEEWVPTTTDELFTFYGMVVSLEGSFNQAANTMHRLSRSSEEISPELLFRSVFSEPILIDRTMQNVLPLGIQTLVVQRGETNEYILQVSAQGTTSAFPLLRELGFILNEQLDDQLLVDFETVLAAQTNNGVYTPAQGYLGFATYFPNAFNVYEDFKDTFGRVLANELSLDVSSERYSFVVEYLPTWVWAATHAN